MTTLARRSSARNVPAFRLIWFGEGVSVLGTATSSILIPLLAVVGLHAGAWDVGLLTSATWLPWVLIGLPAGALVDRWSSRAVMIAADLVSAVALGSVPITWALNAFTIGQLFGVALVTGTATVFFRAAYPSLLRQLVPAEALGDANARMFGTEAAAQVAGPGIGGSLAAAVGSALGLVVDALSFLVSAACLGRLRVRGRNPGRTAADEPLTIRVRTGLRFVYKDRLLRYFTITGGISNFGLTGFGAILVLFLVRQVGLSSGQIGALLAAGSVGGVIGASLAPRLAATLGTARAVILLQLLAAAAAPPLALAGPGLLVVIVPLCMAGLSAGVVGSNVVRGAWRMRYVPAELQARAVTATQLVNFGGMPLAGLAVGWLGDSIGLRATVLTMALVHSAATVSILRSPIRRARELPLPAGTRDWQLSPAL